MADQTRINHCCVLEAEVFTNHIPENAFCKFEFVLLLHEQVNLSDDVCRLDYREVLEGLGQDLVRLDVPPAQALQTIFLWFARVRFEVIL